MEKWVDKGAEQRKEEDEEDGHHLEQLNPTTEWLLERSGVKAVCYHGNHFTSLLLPW